MTRRTLMLCAVVATTAPLLAGCSGDATTTEGTDEVPAVDSGAGVEGRAAEAIVEQTVVSNPDSPDDKATDVFLSSR